MLSIVPNCVSGCVPPGKFRRARRKFATAHFAEDWGYSALGASGHVIAIVHRIAYDPPQEDVDTVIRMVIAASPSVNPVN